MSFVKEHSIDNEYFLWRSLSFTEATADDLFHAISVIIFCVFQVLSSELGMYESQTQEYKYEIERLAHELQNVKKKYLAQKRKEQECR